MTLNERGSRVKEAGVIDLVLSSYGGCQSFGEGLFGLFQPGRSCDAVMNSSAAALAEEVN